MTDTAEIERLKARVRELEAAQAQPAPAAGFMGALSLVGHVVGLVPRPLLVAAGLVFVAWLGFEVYLNARKKMAETEGVETETLVKTDRFCTLDHSCARFTKP